MKDLQLTDRIVVEFTTHDDNIPNNEFIAYNLRRIGSNIEDCCCGGSDKVEDMQNGGEYHILWEHESVSYGGFHMGDNSLVHDYYYDNKYSRDAALRSDIRDYLSSFGDDELTPEQMQELFIQANQLLNRILEEQS